MQKSALFEFLSAVVHRSVAFTKRGDDVPCRLRPSRVLTAVVRRSLTFTKRQGACNGRLRPYSVLNLAAVVTGRVFWLMMSRTCLSQINDLSLWVKKRQLASAFRFREKEHVGS
jgi:hypothetical protein